MGQANVPYHERFALWSDMLIITKSYICRYTAAEEHDSSKVTTNVWKEREEFYKSAMPKDEDEENHMLQLALEESQRQQEICDLWHTDVSQQ